MAKGLNVYIGNPNQQEQVKQQLRTSLEQHTGGIYIIGGPNMVGKDSVIDTITSSLNPARLSMVHTMDDPETLGLIDWLEEEYTAGKTCFVLGEMQSDFRNMFQVINEFFHSKEKPITIFLNLLSREYPAWHNRELQESLKQTVKDVLPEAHFFYLESDPQRIPESVLELYKENQSMFETVVTGLGLTNIPRWNEVIKQLQSNNREGYNRHIKAILGLPSESLPPEIK